MTIVIRKVKEPYGWLGNMSSHPISFQGVIWPTAEHLFQALRFEYGHPVREEIRQQKSPMSAKMVAKKYPFLMVTRPRSHEDVCAMELVLLLKLEQYSDLKVKLLATANHDIVEDCTARATESGLFWGAKLLPGKGEVDGRGAWQGSNVLGNLWMKIRDREQVATLSLPSEA